MKKGRDKREEEERERREERREEVISVSGVGRGRSFDLQNNNPQLGDNILMK